jgi:hypothetical protein
MVDLQLLEMNEDESNLDFETWTLRNQSQSLFPRSLISVFSSLHPSLFFLSPENLIL